MPAGAKIPVLLDTDIGSNIHDALCLAYLLQQPACELVGITTVTGEPEKRAMLADAICRAAGQRDVPIYPGAAIPLLGPQRQPTAPQASVLARWPHRDEFPRNEAVAFMRDLIRSRPGEITLLTIGPLTNVALLFALDPEIPSLLGRLVSMCGVFTTYPERGRAETNTSLDPVAAAIVYQASAQMHLSVGLDVTLRCAMPAEEARKELRGAVPEPVAEMLEVFLLARPLVVFHDPLAAAVLFAPDICHYEQGRVSVALETGLTRWEPDGEEAPHRIAVDVDPEAFFAHYFGVIREKRGSGNS
ncbi:MAG: nucleoside hydrolase [Bacillota bacterium]